MANETGLSQTSATSPELWRARALKARYAKSKVWRKCLNGVEGDAMVSGNIRNKGDTINFSIFPKLTLASISTSDGSVANQAVTPTVVALVIDQWFGTIVDLVDIADIQSVLDWEMELADAFGGAVSEKQDDTVLALVNALTTNVLGGSGSNPLSDSLVLQAIRKLDDLEVPHEDRTWVLAPNAEKDLLVLDKFSLANTTGFEKGLQVNGGRLEGLYGSTVVVTSRVTTDSGYRENTYFHKEAFAIAMQREMKIEKLARVDFAQPYGVSSLWGVKTTRENHAVKVLSAA